MAWGVHHAGDTNEHHTPLRGWDLFQGNYVRGQVTCWLKRPKRHQPSAPPHLSDQNGANISCGSTQHICLEYFFWNDGHVLFALQRINEWFEGWGFPGLSCELLLTWRLEDQCADWRSGYSQCSACQGGIRKGRGQKPKRCRFFMNFVNGLDNSSSIPPVFTTSCWCIYCQLTICSGAVLCVLSLLCLGQDLIKRIILTTTGYDAVNHAVKSRLIDQLTVLFRGCKLGVKRGAFRWWWWWRLRRRRRNDGDDNGGGCGGGDDDHGDSKSED